MIFGKDSALTLLLIMALAAGSASAQNQTPANVGPPVTWTDPLTGLMWPLRDSGTRIGRNEAGDYCAALHLGGYSDWRLPTIDELQGIYDPALSVPSEGYGVQHVKGSLQLSGWEWSSTPDNGDAWHFAFFLGERFSHQDGVSDQGRAICVRRPGKS
jgi:hypothetical protein